MLRISHADDSRVVTFILTFSEPTLFTRQRQRDLRHRPTMLQIPLMRDIKRHVHSRTRHHSAKTALRSSLLELAQHARDLELAHFNRTRLVQTRIVQWYAEKVRRFF